MLCVTQDLRDYFFLHDESFVHTNFLFAVHDERTNISLVEGLRKVKFVQSIVIGPKLSSSETYSL